jgi:signal peptidase I
MSNELPTTPESTPEPAQPGKSWLRELVEAVLPALVIVLVINIFLAQATRVEGQSMEPTLHNNQRLIIEKVSYYFHPPERGEIIVLRRHGSSGDPLIKRVVGLPGETIAIHDGRVYINDQPLEESYLAQTTLGAMPARLVPEEHVFVMGDNRGASNDSRAFGVVSFDDIIGRAWVRYWPPTDVGVITH